MAESSQGPRIAAIVPTFNEFEQLTACIDSLLAQSGASIEPIVVNAGDPLPESLASKVRELRVPSDQFWTACVEAGFAEVRKGGFDDVLLMNADTTLLPRSVERLLLVLAANPGVVACSPGYARNADGGLELLYSHDVVVPFLLHNYLRTDWKSPDEAPDEPYEVETIGGQGVLFPASFLSRFSMDPARFPHYRGDHDLWKTMRKQGIRLLVAPRAGVVNTRPFGSRGVHSRLQRLSKAGFKLGSPLARDSWRTLWNYRRKHYPLPFAVASFLVYAPLVWAYRLLNVLRGR